MLWTVKFAGAIDSMNPHLINKFAIIGIGEAPVGKVPGRSPIAAMLESARLAIQDAGISAGDIDGVIAEPPLSSPRFLPANEVASGLGIRPVYAQSTGVGGASAVSSLAAAIAAISAGFCSVVLFTMGDSSWSYQKGHMQPRGRLDWGYEEFEEVFGLAEAAGGYGLCARSHIEQFGTSERHFGEVAVSARYHASLNSNTQMSKPISMEDYLASRWIVEPFRLMDCSLVSDYGGAFIIAAVDVARELRQPVVGISAVAAANTHRFVHQADPVTTGACDVAERIWRVTGLSPDDIDVAELYDSFTYTTLVQLEDYGFCPKGQGGPFVEGGRIRLGGDLPVNTHGGLLSQGHAGGVLHVTEAVKQLRGDCGERQVKQADIALVTGGGGILFASHAGAVLARL